MSPSEIQALAALGFAKVQRTQMTDDLLKGNGIVFKARGFVQVNQFSCGCDAVGCKEKVSK